MSYGKIALIALGVTMLLVSGINLFRYLRSPESVRSEEELAADDQNYSM